MLLGPAGLAPIPFLLGGSMKLRSLPLQTLSPIAFILLSSLTTWGQTANVPARVTQPVDAANLVTLHGNTHPLARPEFDQGAAPNSPQTCNLTGIGVQPTPPGAYTIQINGQSGLDFHTLSVPVTVQ